MKKLFLTFTITILFQLAISAKAQTDYQRDTSSKLRISLANAKTPRDSIKILYDIFDVVPRNQEVAIGRQIYDIAKRIGDNSTCLDICRQLTACFRDDRSLAEIEKEVSRIPESQEQKETHLFLRMKRLSYSSSNKSETDRQKEIIRILAEEDKGKTKSPTQRLLDLFTLVEFLRNDASGDMLKEYLDRLIMLATSSHFKLYAIPNIVYAEAANVYADAGEAEKSVEADRKLLQIIDGLENKYHSNGRIYRNFDISRYVCYRRMIRNYEALRPGELKTLYDKCMNLRAKSHDVRNDMDTHPRFYAYYYTASGDYNAALPYLKQLLEKDLSLPLRKLVLEHTVSVAEKTGDDETRVKALEEYSTILEELNRLKASERYRELQIKYDVQDLKTRNAELELTNKNEEILSARRLMTFVAVLFVILFIILVLFLHYWGKFKRNASRMGEVVDSIHMERERLRQSLYYDYAEMPGYLAPELNIDGWRERMRKKGIKWDMVSLFMTKSIVNDLLFIAASGHSDLMKYIQETSVDSLLRRVEVLAREGDYPDNGISVEYLDDDFKITTDPECLSILINHIFDTAIHCIPDSTIELSCRKTSENYVDFIITTIGVNGASPEDPQIFNNFITVRRILHRKGSGFFICRLIWLLLNSEIIPDKEYKNGSRYYLRVPVKPAPKTI